MNVNWFLVGHVEAHQTAAGEIGVIENHHRTERDFNGLSAANWAVKFFAEWSTIDAGNPIIHGLTPA